MEPPKLELSDHMKLPVVPAEELEITKFEAVRVAHRKTGICAEGPSEQAAVDNLKLYLKWQNEMRQSMEKCQIVKLLESFIHDLQKFADHKGAESRIFNDPWIAGAQTARAEETAFRMVAFRATELLRDMTPRFLTHLPHCDCSGERPVCSRCGRGDASVLRKVEYLCHKCDR